MGGDPGLARISPNVNVGPDCYANPILADASGDPRRGARGRGTGRLRRLRPDAGRRSARGASGPGWSSTCRTVRIPSRRCLEDIEASWPAELARIDRDCRWREEQARRACSLRSARSRGNVRVAMSTDGAIFDGRRTAPPAPAAVLRRRSCGCSARSRSRRRVLPPLGDVRLPPGRRREPASSSSAWRSSSASVGVFFLYWGMNRASTAARALPRRRATLRLRRAGAGDPRRVPHLPGHQHDPDQLQGRTVGETFVGFDNFKFVFTDENMLRAIRNTAGWIILVPLAAVSIGLAFATLADRLRRGEAVAKSLIFLPMAISFAGASITWTADLRLPARGLRHATSAAERRSCSDSARTPCRGSSISRGTTCS